LKIEDTFGSLLATGLTLMISVQALVNMAIALGMMPVTGITLPFISYGGTSLVISLAAVGVLLNISRYAKMKK
jgi:cell division protein FtsW